MTIMTTSLIVAGLLLAGLLGWLAVELLSKTARAQPRGRPGPGRSARAAPPAPARRAASKQEFGRRS